MKKILLLLFTLCLFGLTACDKKDDSSKTTTEENENTTEETVKVFTHKEYVEAADDTIVTIEAYVQAKQGWWDNKATIYLQDEDGGYFVYNLPCTKEQYDTDLASGNKVQITGKKTTWAGEVEISDEEATFKKVEGSKKYQATDVTDKLGTDNLIKYQNMIVKMNLLELTADISYKDDKVGKDDIYIPVKAGNFEFQLCIEYYLTGADTEVYKQAQKLKKGDKINVEAFLYWYEAPNPHVTKIYGPLNAHGLYMSCPNDTIVTIEAYVQAKQGWWNDKATIYLQNDEGGFFVYGLPCTKAQYENELGKGNKISVTGKKVTWAGEVEISDEEATFELLETTKVYEATDVTNLLSADKLGDLWYLQNMFVAMKNLEVVGEISYKDDKVDKDDIYIPVKSGDYEFTLCIEFYLTGANTGVYNTAKQLKVGDKINAEAFLYWYEAPNPHTTNIEIIR